MLVIGLTGSVGMGKSTTAALFAEQGVPVFDADAAVHALYRGRALAAVEAVFPHAVRAGQIDRGVLASIVTGDAAAMRRLETIVHPLVREERATFLAEAAAAGKPLVVLDIPLLLEFGGEADVDVVVLASAPEPVQKARVLARPGMTEARFEAIRARQMPDAEKRMRAHHVVETGGGLEAARAQVRSVIAALGTGGTALA